MPTQARLKKLFDYDPEVGDFIRKVTVAPNAIAGSVIKSLSGNGYVTVCINYKHHRVHKLAWIYMTGKEPKNLIDHINHIPTDNRFCNLREATAQENCRYRVKSKNNSSGIKGVHYDSRKEKYIAQICVDRHVRKHLGYFDTAKEAGNVYDKKAKELFGEFYLSPAKSPS